jgi:hypothetical protein
MAATKAMAVSVVIFEHPVCCLLKRFFQYGQEQQGYGQAPGGGYGGVSLACPPASVFEWLMDIQYGQSGGGY